MTINALREIACAVGIVALLLLLSSQVTFWLLRRQRPKRRQAGSKVEPDRPWTRS